MADFLTAIKSTVQKESEKKSDAGLTALSTKTKPLAARQKLVEEDDTSNELAKAADDIAQDRSPLKVLRNQPDTETVLHTLRALQQSGDLDTIGPEQAQLITVLVNEIVPAFWDTLDKDERGVLVGCLKNLAGCSAIITRLKFLTKDSGQRKEELKCLLTLATELLEGEDFVADVGRALNGRLEEKEFVNLLGSGRIVGVIAAAEDALDTRGCWLADGALYAAWLGRSIAQLLGKGLGDIAAELVQKGFGLGYSVRFVAGFWAGLTDLSSRLERDIEELSVRSPGFVRRQLLETTLQWLSTLTHHTTQQDGDIPPIAALISLLANSEPSIQHLLLTFLTDPQLSASLSHPVRRAAIIALSPDTLTQTLLEKSITTFGDPLFINRAPIFQQESLAQTLLLTAGRIHRTNPELVLKIARGGGHMKGISNRLDCTNGRARWLGMVVGVGISGLVDKEGSRMDFGTDELGTEEGAWYLDFVKCEDRIGEITEFRGWLKSREGVVPTRRTPAKREGQGKIDGKPVFGPERPPPVAQTEVIGPQISEIPDDDSDDKEGLKPHAKPDSDPEDSDDDATLVNRTKLRPPVYIRDLMRLLHSTDDAPRFEMGLRHAAGLVRRKMGYGREVSDHAEELAGILCNLQDHFSTTNFDDLKLQGIIAVLLADVKAMAPWLSGQIFTGDYSIGQRCMMLTALGMAGRELAGLKNLDDVAPVPVKADFPSKRLPGRLHAVYAGTKQLDSATADVERQLIAPLALQAADKTTSHLDAVKVRTFSSRLSRTKHTANKNQLAPIFAETFFAPLMGHFQRDIAAYGQASLWMSTPFLLVTFLKTIAVLLHASGPATSGLGDVGRVFWEVLLGFRVRAAGDGSVLEAVLFGILTILETVGEGVGGMERLAGDFGREVGETREWVEGVFDRSGPGGMVEEEGGGQEGRVRRLAAGVLVRCGEVLEEGRKRFRGGV